MSQYRRSHSVPNAAIKCCRRSSTTVSLSSSVLSTSSRKTTSAAPGVTTWKAASPPNERHAPSSEPEGRALGLPQHPDEQCPDDADNERAEEGGPESAHVKAEAEGEDNALVSHSISALTTS